MQRSSVAAFLRTTARRVTGQKRELVSVSFAFRRHTQWLAHRAKVAAHYAARERWANDPAYRARVLADPNNDALAPSRRAALRAAGQPTIPSRP